MVLLIAMRGQNAGVGGMIMTNSNMSSMQNVGMTSGSKYHYPYNSHFRSVFKSRNYHFSFF